ncbi:Utp--glucose-1-phosphate uridylyltransferase 3 protein [Thalictrum thalictroides]|uniref:Utp--glucose-1-phosphate uridylyltransferase 3 protein n=1 Tax=Thalictrum thalictroides TaxID=46969 RepID=A0A7J6WWI8_THATH|nr:Utp--glucose-1-phosphate uridylyltransferase 3 protein [Thalictrum thalictroides]
MARITSILHHHHRHDFFLLPPSLPLIKPVHFKAPFSSFSSFSSISLSSSSSSSSCSFSNGVTTRVSTAEVDYAPAPDFDIHEEIARLRYLQSKLSNSNHLKEKLRILKRESRVKKFFDKNAGFSRVLLHSSMYLDDYELFLLNCLVAAGQEHVLIDNSQFDFVIDSEKSSLRNAFYSLAVMIENWDGIGEKRNGFGKNRDGVVKSLKKLLGTLRDIERFYDCIGGIIGYQIKVFELLSSSLSESHNTQWPMHLEESLKCQILDIHAPSVLNLSENMDYASQAALWGIEGLPELGEIYPLGGSGDRLGLIDPNTGECLPAAMLPYCGRTLLEGLIRDLQAREYLYYKMYGKQCITPVAIMTSSAKRNHERITTLCEALRWFGRGRSNFKLFEQPLVPAVSAEDGQWLVSKPFTPVCKPGGHGVIWKLAHDKGVFQWFYGHRRKGATVRQVSNVVAATDVTLLSLAGIGLRNNKKLGFASCKRKSGATEGINVLIEKKNIDGNWDYGLSCIEYTEFDKFGITYGHFSQAEFPANTNIMYIDLASAEKIGSCDNASCLPGMVLNLKKSIAYIDHLGIQHSVSGGRLECTMQNIADNFLNTYSSRQYNVVEDTLDTYIVYNKRERVTSSAKRKRTLANKSLRQIEDNEKYFHSGPPFIILLHPALGPLWEVTRQKFYGGSISKGSELQLEVAELFWRNVELEGSMIVLAKNIMGETRLTENNEPILHYGHRCGRCKLQNVKVLNKGIDWNSAENCYWKHDVQRLEAVKIILHGNAEFEATDVVIQGNHLFEVPDGHKLLVTAGNSGMLVKLIAIEGNMIDTGSWFWKYKLKDTHIHLEKVEI